jgi:hypothetical protein
MNPKKWMIAVAVIVVVLIIAAILFYIYSPKLEMNTSLFPGQVKSKSVTPPEATGNIDDAVNAIMMETTDESSIINEENQDAAIISQDSQEIKNFGQSANENDF